MTRQVFGLGGTFIATYDDAGEFLCVIRQYNCRIQNLFQAGSMSRVPPEVEACLAEAYELISDFNENSGAFSDDDVDTLLTWYEILRNGGI